MLPLPLDSGQEKKTSIRLRIHRRVQEYTEELYKKDFHNPDNHDGDHSPRAKHPGIWSQMGLRKHHYKQS